MGYVTEVQNVINLGIPPEDAVKLYDKLVEEFDHVCGGLEPEEFHEHVRQLRKEERKYYRRIIDRVVDEWGLTWREVKLNEVRIRRCESCMNWFYVTARNGKSLTCERFGTYRRFDLTNREYRYWIKGGRKLSECAVKYELSKRPPTIRRVQEVLYAPSPSSGDIKGSMFLDEVESANQRYLNPYGNEWRYWER